MRTTVSIDDNLLDAAKRRARTRNLTLGQVVEDALRRELATPPERTSDDLPVFHGKGGLQPGVDLTSNRDLRALLDEGMPLGKLR